MWTKPALLLVAVVLVSSAACDAPEPYTPAEAPVVGSDASSPAEPKCEIGGAPITLKATAPMAVNESHLGRPYDKNFEPFVGKAAQTLFPQGQIRKSPLKSMDHQIVAYDSSRELEANVGGSKWGVKVKAEVGKTSSVRFASYRAEQLDEVREIDDMTEMTQAPADAVWYLARIYYGHSFELLVSGEEKRFHAGVKVKYMGVQGGVKTFAANNNLEVTARGRGMDPVGGDAIFARSADEITKAYRISGEAVPVAVEYRSIPRTCIPNDEAITWITPREYRLTYDTIDVYVGGGSWNLDAKCKVNDLEYSLDNRSIWDQRQVPGNKCARGEGPRGANTFCPYNLYWTTVLQAVDGDTIRCGLSGFSDGNPIPYSEFSTSVKSGDQPQQGAFGDGDKNAEYRVKYSFVPVK